MKWTYDWLQDYLKTDADAQTISETLTRIGLEIEDLQSPVSPREKCNIARHLNWITQIQHLK